MSYNQTMTDVAYNCLARKKKEVDFIKLWGEVAKIMQIPEEKLRRKKSQFYSELMLDTRFASLENNKWDLRNRRKCASHSIHRFRKNGGGFLSDPDASVGGSAAVGRRTVCRAFKSADFRLVF